MIIDQLSERLYALRLTPGSMEPEGQPVVNSLLRVFKCQGGFLIEAVAGTIEYGGYYLLAKANRIATVKEVDIAMRTKEVVVFNHPGTVTLVTSPIINDRLKAIVDDQ